MPKSKGIPDRWLDYEPFGDIIKGTRILPLKVPLKESLCSNIPEDKRFTPDDLFDLLKEKNYQLGLIIDLTATTRYYDSNNFTDRDVQYVKVFTPGHVVPSPDIVSKFSTAVAIYEEAISNSDLLIGVHCTHGINRTGYIVCRYLIDNKGFTPEEAIKAFEEARGYPIERENYKNALKRLPSEIQESATGTLRGEDRVAVLPHGTRGEGTGYYQASGGGQERNFRMGHFQSWPSRHSNVPDCHRGMVRQRWDGDADWRHQSRTSTPCERSGNWRDGPFVHESYSQWQGNGAGHCHWGYENPQGHGGDYRGGVDGYQQNSTVGAWRDKREYHLRTQWNSPGASVEREQGRGYRDGWSGMKHFTGKRSGGGGGFRGTPYHPGGGTGQQMGQNRGGGFRSKPYYPRGRIGEQTLQNVHSRDSTIWNRHPTIHSS